MLVWLNFSREAVATYLKEIGRLSGRILDLICEGLGLEAGYLEELSQVQLLVGNHYPPCPDPSLTLGLLKHCDPSLITILLQDGNVCGLQVMNNGKWIGVAPLPHALIVNVGNQLEVMHLWIFQPCFSNFCSSQSTNCTFFSLVSEKIES